MKPEREPSLEEQDIAEKYVLLRPLPRPDTDWRKALRCVALWVLVNLAATFAAWLLLREPLVWLIVPALALVLSLRRAAVGCIRLYQHYADEKTRRRCLFRPTCSEYAILAVKKYGAVIGLILSAHRLLRKCRGSVYRIDYP